MSIPVTVVIPAFNRGETVRRAIKSVQAQTLAPNEILVVDDGSTDRTAAIADDAGARVLQAPENLGAAHARNLGIAAARSPWIAFLDSDDEWLPAHLSTVWPHTERCAFVSAHHVVFGERPRNSTAKKAAVRYEHPAELIFPDNPISMGATLVRRDILQELGGFDENLPISEDFDLWIRLIQKYPLLVLPEVTYVYHRHDGQKTRSVRATRNAQTRLLERYRNEAWWDEAAFDKRRALNSAEVLITEGQKLTAVREILSGIARRPRTYLPVIRVLADHSIRH